MSFTRLFLKHDSVRDPTMPPPDPIPHHFDKCYHLCHVLGIMLGHSCDDFMNTIIYVKENAFNSIGGQMGGHMWASVNEWKNTHITLSDIRTMVYILIKCNILIQNSNMQTWVRFDYINKYDTNFYNVIHCASVVCQRFARQVRNDNENYILTSKQKFVAGAVQNMCDKTEFTSIADI